MALTNRRGFTLIELMVVMLILAVIATIAWRMTAGNVPIAKWETARAEMAEIQKAITEWSLSNNNEFPDSLDEIADRFPGGRTPIDPFKEPYLYEKTEKGFRLTCLGADETEGGTDMADLDIVFDQTGQVQPEE